jgi:NAD(P)-dependent dehydrogenase (short-subunit alcohol dehydrogenase family)
MLPAVRKQRPELVNQSDEAMVKLLGEEMTPVGRFGQPEEIAAIAAFLASDRNGFTPLKPPGALTDLCEARSRQPDFGLDC